MPRLKTNLLISILLFLGIVSFAFAAETITVDTYYPSPYGVYNTLWLYPHDNTDPNGGCSTRGELYFDDSDNSIYYCDGANWIAVGTKSGLPQQQVFRNNGAFVVPAGIRKLKIKMWGAGGGGGRGEQQDMMFRVDGTDGGDTSFGSFIAYGGRGGIGAVPGVHGAGGVGGGYSVGVNIGYDGGTGFSRDSVPPVPLGGSPGFGGRTSGCCDRSVSDPGGGGWGGNPGWLGGLNAGGGGGGGGYVEHIFDVIPGNRYVVIVGVGGIGGGGVAYSHCNSTPCTGVDGAKGMVIVEW